MDHTTMEKTPRNWAEEGKGSMFRFFWQGSSAGRRKVVKRRGFGRWSSDPAASCLGTNQNIVVTHRAGKPRTETSFKPRLSFLTRDKIQ